MKVIVSNPGATSPTLSGAVYSTSGGKACGQNVTLPVQLAAQTAERSGARDAYRAETLALPRGARRHRA
jgi:hypothetical protein